MSAQDVLTRLVEMSRTIAAPEWDCVILGEGNTSARAEEGSFWVKASGHRLATAGPEGYVRVRSGAVLQFLDSGESSDQATAAALTVATIEPAGLRPSIETTMHAFLLSLPGVAFVGHTHPTAVLALVGSRRGRELALSGRLTAEEVGILGPEPCWVPYTDPGVTLGRAVREAVGGFVERWGGVPQQILVENHGLIAVGGTPEEVVTRTQMAVKSARVLVGTLAGGGPHPLPLSEVQRLLTRPDEALRLRKIGGAE